MHPTNNLAISSNNRQIFGIIHEIWQSFHTINTLAKQNGFRIISKRILKQIHIIFILRQSIIHQQQPIMKLIRGPQTNLSIFKIINLHQDLILRLINIGSGQNLIIIEFTFQNVSKLDIFIQQLGDFVGFLDFPPDVFYLLLQFPCLVIVFQFVLELAFLFFHFTLGFFLFLFHLLFYYFQF